MTKTLRKIIAAMLFVTFPAIGGIYPAVSLAARVAGEDVPVPAVTAPSPTLEKQQERKITPPVFPQNLQKKTTAAPTPVRPPVVPVAKQDSAAPPADKEPAKVEQNPSPAAAPAPTSPQATPDKGFRLPSAPPVGVAASPVMPEVVKKPVKDTRYVTIDFDNVDIQVFVKFVSELTGKNFVIDDKVRGKVTIISPRKISLDEVYKVFESVLEVNGFATVTAGEVTKVVPALQAREKQLETRIGAQGADSAADKLITQIITLENANPDEIKRVLEPLISRSSILLAYPPTGMLVITDYQSNIRKIMEIIGALDVEGMASQITYLPLKAANASELVKSLMMLFQAQPGRPTVSPVRIVADDRANALILVASEMETARIKKLIEFMDQDVPMGAATLRVYRLQNAVAEDLAKVLMNIPKATATAPGAAATTGKSPLLSKDVQVTADKATNTLIITANNDDYKILEEVIKALDLARPMVYIEALIMEVNTNKDFRVGVEWRGLKGTGSISGVDTGQTAAFISSGNSLIPTTTISGTTASVGNLPAGFALGILGAGITIGGVSFPNIGAVLNAFQGDTDVSILSNPQIMTLDNEEAEINVGKNVPFISRQDNTSSSTTGIAYSNYEYKDVGVVLNITPHINEEDFVRLKLDQKVSSVFATDANVPGLTTTLKREAKTVVVVKDQETIVIGGMLGDSTSEGVSKVPCLGDIPLLGWLFKSSNKTREKTNLYVFITPHIVRSQGDAAALYKDKREQMGTVVEGVIKLDKIIKKEPVRN